MANDTFQLEQIRSGMIYDDFVNAVKRNFSIMLNAYIQGANVVQFQGAPGVGGNAGERGASMFVIADASLGNAITEYTGNYGVIIVNGENITTAKQAMQSTTVLSSVLKMLLQYDTCITILMSTNSFIDSKADFVMYDTMLFSNGMLMTTTYEVTNNVRVFDVNANALSFASALPIDDITNKIKDSIKNDADFARISNPLTRQYSVGAAYTVNGVQQQANIPSSVIPSAEAIRTLAFIAASTVDGDGEPLGIENVMLVAGTNEQLHDIYEALNNSLDTASTSTSAKDTIPVGKGQPPFMVVQPATGDDSVMEPEDRDASTTDVDDMAMPQNIKTGMVIIDMDSLHHDYQGNNVSSNQYAEFGSFAAITKYQNGLWIMSNTNKSGTDSHTARFGKVYLSRQRFEAFVSGRHKIVAGCMIYDISSKAILNTGGNLDINVAANMTTTITGNRSATISGTDTLTVNGASTKTYLDTATTVYQGDHVVQQNGQHDSFISKATIVERIIQNGGVDAAAFRYAYGSILTSVEAPFMSRFSKAVNEIYDNEHSITDNSTLSHSILGTYTGEFHSAFIAKLLSDVDVNVSSVRPVNVVINSATLAFQYWYGNTLFLQHNIVDQSIIKTYALPVTEAYYEERTISDVLATHNVTKSLTIKSGNAQLNIVPESIALQAKRVRIGNGDVICQSAALTTSIQGLASKTYGSLAVTVNDTTVKILKGNVTETVTGNVTETVTGNVTENITGNTSKTVSDNVSIVAGNVMSIDATALHVKLGNDYTGSTTNLTEAAMVPYLQSFLDPLTGKRPVRLATLTDLWNALARLDTSLVLPESFNGQQTSSMALPRPGNTYEDAFRILSSKLYQLGTITNNTLASREANPAGYTHANIKLSATPIITLRSSDYSPIDNSGTYTYYSADGFNIHGNVRQYNSTTNQWETAWASYGTCVRVNYALLRNAEIYNATLRGLVYGHTIISSSRTLEQGDVFVIANNSSGTIQVDLPPSPLYGQVLYIAEVSSGNVTISGNGSYLHNGWTMSNIITIEQNNIYMLIYIGYAATMKGKAGTTWLNIQIA